MTRGTNITLSFAIIFIMEVVGKTEKNYYFTSSKNRLPVYIHSKIWTKETRPHKFFPQAKSSYCLNLSAYMIHDFVTKTLHIAELLYVKLIKV